MSSLPSTNVDQRLLKSTKFPPEFNTKVDISKVNVQIIKGWAESEIAKLLGNDDDVVPELVFNMLEDKRGPRIKELQISLGGFLDKDAAPFCLQLWKLLISAEKSPLGVPVELLEAKKKELQREEEANRRAREANLQRQQLDNDRERHVDQIRSRDRAARDERRGHSYRDSSYERPRRDRTPPYRARRSPSPRYRRDDLRDDRRPPDIDRYVPDRARDDRRRRRSPSTSRSRSRSREHRRRRYDSRERRHDSRERRRSPVRRRSRSPRRRRSSSSRSSVQETRRRRRRNTSSTRGSSAGESNRKKR